MLRRLNALSAGTQVGQDLLDAVLVDNPKAFVGNTQTHDGRFPVTWQTLDIALSL
jgi:hypothetical protein